MNNGKHDNMKVDTVNVTATIVALSLQIIFSKIRQLVGLITEYLEIG